MTLSLGAKPKAAESWQSMTAGSHKPQAERASSFYIQNLHPPTTFLSHDKPFTEGFAPACGFLPLSTERIRAKGFVNLFRLQSFAGQSRIHSLSHEDSHSRRTHAGWIFNMTAATMVARKHAGGSSRGGGISKRKSAARTDRDGDLVMDSSSKSRGGGVNKARSAPAPGRGKSTRPARGGMSSSTFQSEVLRHVSSGSSSVRAPRHPSSST